MLADVEVDLLIGFTVALANSVWHCASSMSLEKNIRADGVVLVEEANQEEAKATYVVPMADMLARIAILKRLLVGMSDKACRSSKRNSPDTC